MAPQVLMEVKQWANSIVRTGLCNLKYNKGIGMPSNRAPISDDGTMLYVS